MKVIVLVKASKDSEAGKMPSEVLLRAMGYGSNEELLALFEEHRPVIAAMVRRKYEVGVVDFVGKVVVTTADLNRQPVVRLS